MTGVLAVAKVELPRWYWGGLAIGSLLGAAFVHWLIFQSLYRIGALCPYCMVVWTVTIPLLVVCLDRPAAMDRMLGEGPLPMAMVAGGFLVHRSDPDNSGAILELLVHADLSAVQRMAFGYARDFETPGRQPR